jgi:hypothetical protein
MNPTAPTLLGSEDKYEPRKDGPSAPRANVAECSARVPAGDPTVP